MASESSIQDIISAIAGTGDHTVHQGSPTDATNVQDMLDSMSKSINALLERADSDAINVVTDYGADNTGVADAGAAINSAFTEIATRNGGVLIIPGGSYLCSTEVAFDLNSVKNTTVVMAYGATITNTGAIAGMRLTGANPDNPVTIMGLRIDHDGDADATYGFDCRQVANLNLVDCFVYADANVPAGYAAYRIANADATDTDTGSFWTRIERCRVASKSGDDMPTGVLIEGSSNATIVENGVFKHCDDAVLIQRQSGQTFNNVANAVLIQGNDFSGSDQAIRVTGNSGDDVKGLRIIGNRCEACTTFFSYSGQDTDSAWPPLLMGNFLVSDVTNYILNANNLIVTSFDAARTPSIDPSGFNNYDGGITFGQPVALNSPDAADRPLVIIGGGSRGLHVRNGTTNTADAFQAGWNGTGTEGYIRTNSAQQLDIYTIRSLSQTATPGENLRGSATFATAATVAVSFGTNEPDTSYFVALSGSANETFWVTSKAVGGFTLNSSNASSTATVDWILIR